MVDPGGPASADEVASQQFSELMYRMLILGLGAPAFSPSHPHDVQETAQEQDSG